MPTFKDRLKEQLGYDPRVTAAASVTDVLAGSTNGVGAFALNYVDRLFPFTKWILNYNLSWAYGDLVAGLTVGMVVVPQSMSYAKIATLSPEYGLYSSFVGVMIYAIFATSKDVTIGPVAVMSLEVSKVIAAVQAKPGGAEYTAPIIATCLAFITGFIALAIGLFRLGWIIEFIPAPAIAGFMTGSAINIAAGQVPSLMGYSSLFNTRASTYQVIINSLKHLPNTQRDAAFGLSGIIFLYTVRWICNRIEARSKSPALRRAAFFANTLKTAFAIIILTVFSWVHLRHKKSSKYDISILKTVPSGFKHMGTPKDIDSNLLSLIAPQIPVSTILLVLEHIAISKSFGRVNNYKIDPNQELIAIGVTNTLGTLFNAYPATGSFSRSAIKAKAGVRTPLAGWITGVVVVIALYALTDAFYWIPNAALSAVIIVAVGDLIASPRQFYGYWKVSPLEAVIFFVAVVVTVFTTIEIGIYTSICASAALLLYRIARPRGRFIGRVQVHTENGGAQGTPATPRDVYVPILPDGIRNPLIKVVTPPPGVIIFRFEEALLYPNSSYYSDIILDYAKLHTRSGRDYSLVKPGDRPWNDPGPSRWSKAPKVDPGAPTPEELEKAKPVLRAVIFDFSGVSNVDTTSVQNLVDLRRVLERFADGDVEFHFATILSPWIKRALLAGGFGSGRADRPVEVAPVVNNDDGFGYPHPSSPPKIIEEDVEQGSAARSADSGEDLKSDLEAPVVSTDTTAFHLDLPSAVASVVGSEKW
ncbi:sulfate permease [Pseudohyphozyma bogoriensis]|nr:sulfate permease [Pseudohyphozyma bogoriensis]